jgi:hypothetical protein
MKKIIFLGTSILTWSLALMANSNPLPLGSISKTDILSIEIAGNIEKPILNVKYRGFLSCKEKTDLIRHNPMVSYSDGPILTKDSIPYSNFALFLHTDENCFQNALAANEEKVELSLKSDLFMALEKEIPLIYSDRKGQEYTKETMREVMRIFRNKLMEDISLYRENLEEYNSSSNSFGIKIVTVKPNLVFNEIAVITATDFLTPMIIYSEGKSLPQAKETPYAIKSEENNFRTVNQQTSLKSLPVTGWSERIGRSSHAKSSFIRFTEDIFLRLDSRQLSFNDNIYEFYFQDGKQIDQLPENDGMQSSEYCVLGINDLHRKKSSEYKLSVGSYRIRTAKLYGEDSGYLGTYSNIDFIVCNFANGTKAPRVGDFKKHMPKSFEILISE